MCFVSRPVRMCFVSRPARMCCFHRTVPFRATKTAAWQPMSTEVITLRYCESGTAQLRRVSTPSQKTAMSGDTACVESGAHAQGVMTFALPEPVGCFPVLPVNALPRGMAVAKTFHLLSRVSFQRPSPPAQGDSGETKSTGGDARGARYKGGRVVCPLGHPMRPLRNDDSVCDECGMGCDQMGFCERCEHRTCYRCLVGARRSASEVPSSAQERQVRDEDD